MNNDKEFLRYNDFIYSIKKIGDEIKKQDFEYIYGISRGGLVPAVYLSYYTGLPLTSSLIHKSNSVIIDDISDSGKTLLKFQEQGYKIFTIFFHKDSIVRPDFWVFEKKDKWIIFPWERNIWI